MSFVIVTGKNKTPKKSIALLLFTILVMLIALLITNIADPTAHSIDKTRAIYSETQYLLDPSNKLTIADVISQPENMVSAPLSDIPWDFTQQSYWLSIKLKNKTPKKYQLFAHFDNPMLDDLRVYQLNQQQKVIKTKQLGDLFTDLNLSEKTILNFKFEIQANKETQLLIRLKSTGLPKTPIYIYDNQEYRELTQAIHLVWGLFVGILIMIALYNLVLFFSIKDTLYLIYVAYTLTILILMGVVLGFGYYLWPQIIQNQFQIYVVPINFLTAIFTLLFAVYFLRYHKTKGRLYHLSLGYIYCMLALMFLSFWLPEYIAAQIFFVIMGGLYLLSSILIFNKLVHSYFWAKFYAISWLPLITGATIQPMMLTGVIEYSFLTRHSFMIGVLFEIVLMAMALAERMRFQKEKALYNATHDLDSGLPNSNMFESVLQNLIDDNRLFSVCLIEISNYQKILPYISNKESQALLNLLIDEIHNKIISDGHYLYIESFDDEIIKIAKVKEGIFAIIAARFINENELLNQLRKIQDSLSKDIELSGFLINLETKIGVCSTPENKVNASLLLKMAFQALEKSKLENNAISTYQQSDTFNVAQRLTLATELQQAIHNNKLQLYHQPQIQLSTGKICGSEVLLRWDHPKHGFISPEMFIAIAEDTGLINELTLWVLDQGCAQLQRLLKLGYSEHKLSINISSKDISMRGFFQKIIDCLNHYNIPKHLLTLELTESVLVKDFSILSTLMSKLSQVGIQVSIDDYGTGYSSLAYLSQLPFNTLKIDKSFILNLDQSKRNISIVKTTIDMAKSLQLNLIAEGIETAEVENQLIEIDCDIGQGYFYSKPLPFDLYQIWLEKQKVKV